MNSTLTKGAVSAALAAALLLGGAGSLAYWNDAETAAGSTVNSGHLKLVTSNAGDWKLNTETATYAPATQRLVPGDRLTRVVTFTVNGSGDYLKAAFAATNPAWNASGSQALKDELVLTGAYQVSTDGGSTWTNAGNGSTPTVVKNGDLVRATLTINWPFGTVDNDSNVAGGLSATLDDVTVTVTQTN